MRKEHQLIILALSILVVGLFAAFVSPSFSSYNLLSAGPTGAQVFSPGALAVVSSSPASACQAATIQLNITGTDFNSSAVVNVSNPNVTVGTPNVVNSTLLEVNVTVSINATVGSYDVVVNQSIEEFNFSGGFNITSGPFNPSSLINLSSYYLTNNASYNLTYNITTCSGVNKSQVNITSGWMNATNMNTSNWTVLNLTNATDPEGTFTLIFDEFAFTEDGVYDPELYLDLEVDEEYIEAEYYAPYFEVGAANICDFASDTGQECCPAGTSDPPAQTVGDCPDGTVCGADLRCEPVVSGGSSPVVNCPLFSTLCQFNGGGFDAHDLCEGGAPPAIFTPSAPCFGGCTSPPWTDCTVPTYDCSSGTLKALSTGEKVCSLCGDGVLTPEDEECEVDGDCAPGGTCSASCVCEFPPTPPAVGGGGGGGGGGGLNYYLKITDFDILADGKTFETDNLYYEDVYDVFAEIPIGVYVKGYIVTDSFRAKRIVSVMARIGSSTTFVNTDPEGNFEFTIDDITRFYDKSSYGIDMVMSFIPRLYKEPSTTTYAYSYEDNPTINIERPSTLFVGAPKVEVPLGVGVFPQVTRNGDVVQFSGYTGPELPAPLPEPGGPIIGGVPEEEVPAPPPEPEKKKILPVPPGIAGCSLECQFDGRYAWFLYNPKYPDCPLDFKADCNYGYMKKPGDTDDFASFVDAQMDVCCELAPSAAPAGAVTTPPPPPLPEEPKKSWWEKFIEWIKSLLKGKPAPEEPGVPPAEFEKCKLVCKYQAPNAIYSYVPTGPFDCKEDFKVKCDTSVAGEGAPLFYVGMPGQSQAEIDEVNAQLDECCQIPPAEPGPGSPGPGPGGPGDKCTYNFNDRCVPAVPGEVYVREHKWLPGGNDPCEDDYSEVLYTCTITGPEAGGMEYPDTNKKAVAECCPYKGSCKLEHDIRCMVGGGAFLETWHWVGAPCPPDGEEVHPCGGTAGDFWGTAGWMWAGTGTPFGGYFKPGYTLPALVGQKNYDECCAVPGQPEEFYGQECEISTDVGPCVYYPDAKDRFPFWRKITIISEGIDCPEPVTNYYKCACSDMLAEYGECGSIELALNSAVKPGAAVTKAACCPGERVPGTPPPIFTPRPWPVLPSPIPSPDTPPPQVPPPTIVPDIPPPPMVDPCVVEGGSVSAQTELVPAPQLSFPAGFIPSGSSLVDSVRVKECAAPFASFKASISNIYSDVKVFKCRDGICAWVDGKSDSDLSCDGSSLEKIFTPVKPTVLEVSEMGVIISIGKEISDGDRIIESDKYKIEFPDDLPRGVVSLSRPDYALGLPKNYCLGLIGTPLQVTMESAPTQAKLTMPVSPVAGATSYSIYALRGEEWLELGGIYDVGAGTISVYIQDLSQFVRNGKAFFIVTALTCHATEDSCVMLHEAGNSELLVLVHGFTSNAQTWMPFVTEAKLNNEQYDILAFQYSPSDTTDAAAQGFKNCLSTRAGRYSKYSVVAHSVGGVVALKGFNEMDADKASYPVINTVDKVITLGMPNDGIDIFVMSQLARLLANYPTIATAFDRQSVIAKEIINPTWSQLKPVPEWAHHIAVAGTVDCDFAYLLADIARPVGHAGLLDPVRKYALPNDCVITVENAFKHIENQEVCSNTFTPDVWHIALNDNKEVRKLIFYLLNTEKAASDPTKGFAGYNQYVSWSDECSPGTVYGVVGKEGSAKKPLFCNCGDNVCDATIGETEGTCPVDCFGWNILVCIWLKNISFILLLLFTFGFGFYSVKKYLLRKEVQSSRWRVALWVVLATAVLLLLISAFICPTVPVLTLLLTALLGAALLFENLAGSIKSRKAGIPISDIDEQVQRLQDTMQRLKK